MGKYKLSLGTINKLLELLSMAWKYTGTYTSDDKLVFRDQLNKQVSYERVMRSIATHAIDLNYFTDIEGLSIRKAFDAINIMPRMYILKGHEFMTNNKLKHYNFYMTKSLEELESIRLLLKFGDCGKYHPHDEKFEQCRMLMKAIEDKKKEAADESIKNK